MCSEWPPTLLVETLENEGGYCKIFMGDFNSKIGKDVDLSEVLGNFSSGDQTNESGEN